MIRRLKLAKEKRKARVRAKIRGISARPRLSVFRSNCHIYAQIINDEKGETLVSGWDREVREHKRKSAKMRETEVAYLVGEKLAKKALDKGIDKVVFDRGPYKYHGRVKSLAEGARKGGLEF